jgi:hypothetical protein
MWRKQNGYSTHASSSFHLPWDLASAFYKALLPAVQPPA